MKFVPRSLSTEIYKRFHWLFLIIVFVFDAMFKIIFCENLVLYLCEFILLNKKGQRIS